MQVPHVPSAAPPLPLCPSCRGTLEATSQNILAPSLLNLRLVKSGLLLRRMLRRMPEKPAWRTKRKGEAESSNQLGSEAKEARKTEQEIRDALTQKDIATILNLLLKLTLQCAQTLRDLTGCLWLVFIVDNDLPIVQAVKKAGKEYADHIQELKKEGKSTSGVAPPHVQKWCSMMEAFEEAEEVQKADKEGEDVAMKEGDEAGAAAPKIVKDLLKAVKEFNEKVDTMTEEQVGASVPFFRMKETYRSSPKDPVMQKISFFLSFEDRSLNYAGLSMLDLILGLFSAVGGVRKTGAPPPGPMERVAQRLLTDHWKGGKGK